MRPRTGKIARRTRDRHADVHRMLAEGRNFREIARELGLSRNTVRRFARAASPEELLVNVGTGRQANILDQHAAYLREELRLHQRRPALGRAPRPRLPRRPDLRPPVPRALPRKRRRPATQAGSAEGPGRDQLDHDHPANLADADKAGIEAILATSPELAAVAESVRAFAAIMNGRRGLQLLEPWITAAEPPASPRSAPSSSGCAPTRTPSPTD